MVSQCCPGKIKDEFGYVCTTSDQNHLPARALALRPAGRPEHLRLPVRSFSVGGRETFAGLKRCAVVLYEQNSDDNSTEIRYASNKNPNRHSLRPCLPARSPVLGRQVCGFA